MDTVVLSDEEWNGEPYKSLYMRAVDVLRESLDPAEGPLATRWFCYDKLALVRTQTFVDVGGWDTMIPFYTTDCDMRMYIPGIPFLYYHRSILPVSGVIASLYCLYLFPVLNLPRTSNADS